MAFLDTPTDDGGITVGVFSHIFSERRFRNVYLRSGPSGNSINTIVLMNAKIYISKFYKLDLERILLLNCRVLLFHSNAFTFSITTWQWGPFSLTSKTECRWKFTVKLPQKFTYDDLLLDKDTKEPEDRWLYRALDRLNCIWPYGQNQLDWLTTTLNNLQGFPLRTVQNADQQLVAWRSSTR